MTIDLHQLKDVLERAISTYVQSVAGLIAASGMADLDLSTLKVLAVSAAPAALAIVKG
ncbi:MAG: hypothetical protein HOE75_09865, partial [Chloroflexi bacterium]|nr:hypothetical protein [Chloroflexota bacterium]